MFSNSFPLILDLYSMLPTVYFLNKIPWRIKVNIIYHGGRPCPSSVLTIKAADNRRYSMQCSDGTYSLFKIQTKTPRATMDRNLIAVVGPTRRLHFITHKTRNTCTVHRDSFLFEKVIIWKGHNVGLNRVFGAVKLLVFAKRSCLIGFPSLHLFHHKSW